MAEDLDDLIRRVREYRREVFLTDALDQGIVGFGYGGEPSCLAFEQAHDAEEGYRIHDRSLDFVPAPVSVIESDSSLVEDVHAVTFGIFLVDDHALPEVLGILACRDIGKGFLKRLGAYRLDLVLVVLVDIHVLLDLGEQGLPLALVGSTQFFEQTVRIVKISGHHLDTVCNMPHELDDQVGVLRKEALELVSRDLDRTRIRLRDDGSVPRVVFNDRHLAEKLSGFKHSKTEGILLIVVCIDTGCSFKEHKEALAALALFADDFTASVRLLDHTHNSYLPRCKRK